MMAQQGLTTSTGEALPGYNYVAQDQIWKDHVHHEEHASKNWPENWQFLTTKYDDLVKDDFPNRIKGSGKDKRLPTPMQIPMGQPIEERVTVKPSVHPVPHTTAKMIGWRSGERDLRLERYGGYAKPRGSLINQLKWPAEAID